MENKFIFLTKHSLKKNIKSKWFKIVNVIVMLVIVALVNIDGIVTFFGGDFSGDVKINVIDNTGYYNVIEKNLKNVGKYLNDSKVIIKKVNDLNKEKKKLKGKKDILLVIKEDKDNFFNAEFITDSYVDTLKYQAIKASLNSAKEIIAINNSNIDKDELAKISKEVTIKRTFVDKEKSKDEESSRSLLSVLSLIIVLPCFMLIMFLVQMIGAEINEEKSTRGMEIIIGNVSAKVHFFSKVLASNLFVLFQGFLLLMYSGIGLIVRKLTSKSSGSFSALKDAASTLDLTGAVDLIKNSGIIKDDSAGKVSSTSYGNYYDSTFTIPKGTLYAKHLYLNKKKDGVSSSWYFWNGGAGKYSYGIVNDENGMKVGVKTGETVPENATRPEGAEDAASNYYTADGRIEIATGSSDDTRTNNIYDLAGNMWEWITETKTRKNNGNNTNYLFAVLRGGGFNYGGSDFPVVYRHGYTTVSFANVYIGFRAVLYIE